MTNQPEIKFRGQRVDNKEWVIGDLLHDKLTGKRYIFGHDKPFEHYILNIHSYEVIPETVGQFIGFYDINGKEIYNKQNLTTEDGGIYTVYWFTPDPFGVSGWYAKNKYVQCPIHLNRQENVIEHGLYIHDNPELLEQKELEDNE